MGKFHKIQIAHDEHCDWNDLTDKVTDKIQDWDESNQDKVRIDWKTFHVVVGEGWVYCNLIIEYEEKKNNHLGQKSGSLETSRL